MERYFLTLSMATSFNILKGILQQNGIVMLNVKVPGFISTHGNL